MFTRNTPKESVERMKHYCRYCIHCIAQDETEAVCEELNIMIKKLPFGTLASYLIFAKDRILSDYTRAAQMAEDAEEKIFSLQDELAHCKADLYDFYAKAGKLPDYERR